MFLMQFFWSRIVIASLRDDVHSLNNSKTFLKIYINSNISLELLMRSDFRIIKGIVFFYLIISFPSILLASWDSWEVDFVRGKSVNSGAVPPITWFFLRGGGVAGNFIRSPKLEFY
jgi:hypothetical protein